MIPEWLLPFFKWTERPNINSSKLRYKVDVSWSPQGMGYGVSSMVKWACA